MCAFHIGLHLVAWRLGHHYIVCCCEMTALDALSPGPLLHRFTLYIQGGWAKA